MARALHRKLQRNLYHWPITERPQKLITGAFIHAMVIALIALDRHQLGYLNDLTAFA
jgi:hypothetical protein